MSIFSERLLQLQSEKKLLKKNIAQVLGVTYRHYQRYETGEIDPPTSKTIALANLFDVSLDYLVGRTDNPDSHKN